MPCSAVGGRREHGWGLLGPFVSEPPAVGGPPSPLNRPLPKRAEASNGTRRSSGGKLRGCISEANPNTLERIVCVIFSNLFH